MSELPEGWQMLRLGEVAARTSNVDPSKSPAEEFELYSVPSFTDRHPEASVGAEIKSVKQAVQPDDVLLCKIVPHINRVWVVGAKSDRRQIASGEWIVYRDHGCDPNYLRCCLTEQSFRDRFMQTVAGVGGSLMRARPSEVAEIEVPLPPLPEQRRIVAKIDSLTGKSRRARDHLDHIPRLVEKYKQAVLAAAFRGDLTREWDNDDSVTNEDYDAARMTLCAELKCRPWKLNETAPEVRNAPVRWRRCYVGQLVAHRSGIAFESKDFSASGTQVVRLGNLYQGRLDLTRQPVFLASEEKYSPFLAQGGDILVSQTGTKYKRDYGHFVIVPEDMRLLVNQRVACLTPTEHLNAAFLSFFSQTNEFRDYFFSRETGGVSQGNVGLAGIMDAPLALPSRAEQDEIVRRIKLAYSAIDRLASGATNARRLIDRLDQAVLAKAFRGELVPQDPGDEPASVLLDRIRAERGAAPKTRRGRKAKASA